MLIEVNGIGGDEFIEELKQKGILKEESTPVKLPESVYVLDIEKLRPLLNGDLDDGESLKLGENKDLNKKSTNKEDSLRKSFESFLDD